MMMILKVSVALLLLHQVLFAAYPGEYPLFLRMLDLSKEQLRRLHDGGVIHKSLKQPDGNQNGITVARVFNVPPYYVRDYYLHIERFKTIARFWPAGKFDPRPNLQDLAPLQLSEEELQALQHCIAGNCAYQLTAGEIESLPRGVSTGNEEGRLKLAQSYREILLRRLLDYQTKTGDAATEQYALRGIGGFDHIRAYFPDVFHYLQNYPQSRNRRVHDLFYWTREGTGQNSIITLRHVFSQRVDEDFVVVDNVIYANHSILSSVQVFHLIAYADTGSPGTLAVLQEKYWLDPATQIRQITKTLSSQTRRELDVLADTIERRYRWHQYENFPYAALPGDQQ